SDTVSGSLLQTTTPGDSIISFRIDTTLIRQWIQTNTGYLILIPTGSTVVGFSPVSTPTDLRPELKVYSNGNDTTPASFRMSPGIFVANGPPPAGAGEVTLQAGVAYRGIVRFDSIAIPKRVSITQALLEIAIDTTSSLMNTYSNDNIVASLL